MKTFLLAAAAVSLMAGSAFAQDKPAGAMSSSMSSSAMSTSAMAKPAMASPMAKPMSKKDMKAMEACHKMDADAMAKSAKCQKLMAMAKPMTDSAMPMKK